MSFVICTTIVWLLHRLGISFGWSLTGETGSMYNNLLRCFSILFFSLGFLFGMWFKDKRKNAYWRVYGLLPLCVMTAILPFLPSNALIELPIIAFSAGIMMKTFTGSQIENHPFVIFMTSGNYRRMLTALY